MFCNGVASSVFTGMSPTSSVYKKYLIEVVGWRRSHTHCVLTHTEVVKDDYKILSTGKPERGTRSHVLHGGSGREVSAAVGPGQSIG